jgi:hypothetical protein
VFRWFVFVDFPTFSNIARPALRQAANRIEKDLIAFVFRFASRLRRAPDVVGLARRTACVQQMR